MQESIDALKSKYPDVPIRPLQVNLGSQQSVRAAAAEFLGWEDVPTLDIVVNSAAVMCLPERTIGEDGIEITFATNHIGHYLLTNLLMPKILKAAEKNPKGTTRIINVSSASPMYGGMRWSDTNFEKTSRELPEAERPNPAIHAVWGLSDVTDVAYIPLEAYNQSKVANVLFSIALSKRLYEKHGILSLALHPGIMQTELDRSMTAETLGVVKGFKDSGAVLFKTRGAGASTSLVAALDPSLGSFEIKDGKENYGVYLEDCQLTDKATALATSSAEAEKLWKMSEKLVKEEFSW